MITLIDDLPTGVVGLRAEGQVTKDDYERQVMPAVEAAIREHGRVRLLYVLGADLGGFSFGAMWDDAKLGVSNLRAWERIAIVAGPDWAHNAVRAFGWMIPGEVRAFGEDEMQEAISWLST